MTLNFLIALSFGTIVSLSGALNAIASQNGQNGQRVSAHLPILYEAYYPEPSREWNPRTGLRKIDRLRDLIGELLREEEQLRDQLKTAASQQPSNQIIRYVFNNENDNAINNPVVVPALPVNDQVQVASLTISDVGPQQQQQQHHKTRHHHGQANWLLRRLAGSA